MVVLNVRRTMRLYPGELLDLIPWHCTAQCHGQTEAGCVERVPYGCNVDVALDVVCHPPKDGCRYPYPQGLGQ